jgi:carbon-monoxide dehydrogenase large subunit
MSVPRVEDGRLLTGRGFFVADVELPRMLHACFVRSYLPHARIESILVDNAVALEGVVNVLLAQDLPEVSLGSTRHPTLLMTPQAPLARDRVRFVGEAVALVVAEDPYVAEDAAELVEVSYTPLDDEEPLHETVPDNVVFRDELRAGPVDEAFASARHVVNQQLDMARQNASPLEPRGCVADYDPAARTLTVHAATQAPHRLRRDLAAVTGLGEQRIRVVNNDIGGGFGQKIPTHLEDVAVVLASMALGRPVKWVEDRRENLIAAPQSRGQRMTLDLALDHELRMSAARAGFEGDSGAYAFNSASPLTEAYRASRALPGVYRLGSYSYDTTIMLTTRAPLAPYRGVGFVAAQVLRELAIDKAARAAGVDPREVRRRNLITPDDLPFTTLTGWRFAHVSFQETFDAASALLDQAVRDTSPPEPGWLRGTALTPFVEPSGMGSRGGIEVHGSASPSHDSARVTLDPTGGLSVSFGTPSIGQGLETTMAQMAADAVGARMSDVSVFWGDTSQAPVSFTGARASRSAVVSGGAVRLAGLELRDQLVEVAAELLEVDTYALRIEDSQVWVEGEETSRLTLQEVAASAFTADRSQTKTGHAFDVVRTYDPEATYSNATVAAILDVEQRTGAVQVRYLAAVEDCGQVINPMIVDGQFIGGAAQGIGAVLLERVAYSDDGQPLTSTLLDYLLPTAADVPRIEVHHHIPLDPGNPDAAGVKGVGESGVIGAAGAVACALADALAQVGGEVTRLPMLPFQVWEQLQ